MLKGQEHRVTDEKDEKMSFVDMAHSMTGSDLDWTNGGKRKDSVSGNWHTSQFTTAADLPGLYFHKVHLQMWPEGPKEAPITVGHRVEIRDRMGRIVKDEYTQTYATDEQAGTRIAHMIHYMF